MTAGFAYAPSPGRAKGCQHRVFVSSRQKVVTGGTGRSRTAAVTLLPTGEALP